MRYIIDVLQPLVLAHFLYNSVNEVYTSSNVVGVLFLSDELLLSRNGQEQVDLVVRLVTSVWKIFSSALGLETKLPWMRFFLAFLSPSSNVPV
jgi:hypothetical protein